MQKSKHTPGPWDDAITGGVPEHIIVSDGRNGEFIASVALTSVEGEEIANAHLIAAAPELLEALKAVQLFHYGCNWHHEDDCSLSCGGPACDCGCDLVKEAIKKAESE